MTLTKGINKNQELRKKNYQESIEPESNNPIYLKEINCLGCHFCHSRGRKKKFKNLWRLYYHHKQTHPNENYKELIMSLADLVTKGILK